MNCGATIIETVRSWPIARYFSRVGSSAGFDDGAERFLHIFRHFDLVVPGTPMKPQHRYAPLVHDAGVEFAIGILIRNHLSERLHANRRPVGAATILFERMAVAFEAITRIVELAYHRHKA